MAADARELSVTEALSGIFGSISIAAWTFVLVPQFWVNYKNSSAAGISVPFLLIWFLGDVTNLIGAAWASLVPTVIALAVYFCATDTIILSQCFYYNLWVNRGRRSSVALARENTAQSTTSRDGAGEHVDDESDENQPLLSRSESNGNRRAPPRSPSKRDSTGSNAAGGAGAGASESHRRRVSTASNLAKVPENGTVPGSQPRPTRASRVLRSTLINALSLLGVCVIGTLGWLLAYQSGAWKPAPPPESSKPNNGSGTGEHAPIGAEIFGYASALLYLGARIPQIIKNWREQSCEGLSLLFFLLSLAGNAAYGAGILFHSVQREYVITNLPWLIGSLGTMAEDVTIFVQFHLYGDKSEDGEDDSIAVDGATESTQNYGATNTGNDSAIAAS